VTVDPAWFAGPSFNRDDYVLATYVFETERDPRRTAAHICQEQSTPQWRRVGVDEDLRGKHGAKVVSVRVLSESTQPLIPGRGHGPFRHVEAVIAHPHVNFGPRLPNLLAVLLGEGIFYTAGVSAIRLTGLWLPDAYAAAFPGPQFGVRGLRDLLAIPDRPFFIGVVKPNIGLSPPDFAALAEQAWMGGLDIAKDDEMLGDMPWSPLAERAARCGEARARAERATGERKMYVANITDEIDRLPDLHDAATRLGANALMLNSLPMGLSAARSLRARAQVPLVSHFILLAALTRVPGFGVDSHVLTTLQRLAGFDVILFPGTGERMHTTEAEVRANIRACLQPLGRILPALPVAGGSSRPADLPESLRIAGTVDFGMVPGRGVFNHPGGPAAGARSFRQAWDAVKDGVALAEKAKTAGELRQSLEAFGE